jgi:hypothetical protein
MYRRATERGKCIAYHSDILTKTLCNVTKCRYIDTSRHNENYLSYVYRMLKAITYKMSRCIDVTMSRCDEKCRKKCIVRCIDLYHAFL